MTVTLPCLPNGCRTSDGRRCPDGVMTILTGPEREAESLLGPPSLTFSPFLLESFGNLPFLQDLPPPGPGL